MKKSVFCKKRENSKANFKSIHKREITNLHLARKYQSNAMVVVTIKEGRKLVSEKMKTKNIGALLIVELAFLIAFGITVWHSQTPSKEAINNVHLQL